MTDFLCGLEDAYISVLSIHEIVFGIERLVPGSKRRLALTKAIEALLGTFRDRLLPISQAEARAAGSIRASLQTQGRTLHIIDSLIAATALVHGLTVATRNVNDFSDLGVMLRNPWHAV